MNRLGCAIARLAFVACTPFTAFAADHAGLATELNGIRLEQFTDAVQGLGSPEQTRRHADQIDEIYLLNDGSQLTVSHHRKQPQTIARLQLSGTGSHAQPFMGLRLGDSEAKVIATLGVPDQRETEPGASTTRLSWKDRNYDVELDTTQRLHSIRIWRTPALFDANADDDPWPAFKSALQSGRYEAIQPWLRPDFAVVQNHQARVITKPYADFVKRPDPALLNALIGNGASLRRQLKTDDVTALTRPSETLGLARIYQFNRLNAIREVVFYPYLGHYRLYEIRYADQRR